MTEPAPPPAIECDHVSRWYGNIVAVNDISFSLSAGITGLLGPNGAGKSTMLHMLAGFLQPSAGAVRVLGQPAWGNPEMYRQVGLVPEREAVYPFLTGYEFVLDSARLHHLPDPEDASLRAIRMVELEDAMGRATGGYSKGMKQRIKIAAALVHEPTVLLLDEPFNGADPRQRLHLMSLLRDMAAAGKTIVFSSHILEEVERLAEEVLVIVSGRLAASGDFREIRRLMTDRPHTFTVRASDNRRLAASLVADPSVYGVEMQGSELQVRTSEFAAFTMAVAGVARRSGVTIFEMRPTDESLESVFSYLVKR
ncbi:MAG TPA: ABC transporter ATP-binding protein [Tepidiformaceae bacterium]|nr:ABC transporter ATP-binding protein [Tepidiformaceae bacterium]HNO64952.1 ABC transporter ATP-binding protein [Tepidiformaceae bacterium]